MFWNDSYELLILLTAIAIFRFDVLPSSFMVCCMVKATVLVGRMCDKAS
jgi:hypothetical protein